MAAEGKVALVTGAGSGIGRACALSLAKAGWSKSDIKRHLFEHARIPAQLFECMLRDWTLTLR